MAPQETPATSQVLGEKEPGLILAEAPPSKADAQGATSQVVPGSPVPKSDELASSAPMSEAHVVTPQETLASSSVPGEKAPIQVSAEPQAPKPTKWKPIDLDTHESLDGKYHTIGKHVAKDFMFLQDRLDTEHWVKRASTYTDKRQAHAAVHMVMENRADDIKRWLADPKSPKQLEFSFAHQIGSRGRVPTGFVLERGASGLTLGHGAKMYLRKDMSMPNGFRIVTSYPIP
ncbi:MAG: filamentous hemagglutinin family outer membrane protein [Actinomycetia bacterium]|nr:filamentous hemagglutinin family outer membrane protein [Actinomycetes bacterium]